MYKRTTFEPFLPDGEPSVVPVAPGPGAGAKTAVLTTYPRAVQEYVKALQPKEGSIYYLSNALGCEEKWGANRNGDSFPEQDLAHEGDDFGYRTFMVLAHPFLGHDNTDPTKGFGDIPMAAYDRQLGRVYVVMRIDTLLPHFSRIEDVVRAIERGDPTATSMGCVVPHDVCSICGNEAKSRRDYCVHARYYMNQTWPDGRKVFVRNVRPRFFDNSLLKTRGADPAAFILATVARGKGRSQLFLPDAQKLSADLADESYDLRKVAQALGETNGKRSALTKEVPSSVEPTETEEVEQAERTYRPLVERLLGVLRAHEAPLDPRHIEELAACGLPTCLSTLHFLGVDLRPEEFQRLGLMAMGRGELAEQLEKQGVVFGADARFVQPDRFTPVSPALIDWDLAHRLACKTALLNDRSGHRPFVLDRVLSLAKQADEGSLPAPSIPPRMPERSPMGLLAALGGLYFALKRTALGRHPSFLGMSNELKSRPWALPLLVLGSVTVPKLYRDLVGPRVLPLVDQDLGAPYSPVFPGAPKQAGLLDRPLLRFGVGLPSAYMLAGHLDTNQYVYGKEPGPFGRLVQDHPAALGIGFGLFGGSAARQGRKALSRWTGGSGGMKGHVQKLSYLRDAEACRWMPPWVVDDAIRQTLADLDTIP